MFRYIVFILTICLSGTSAADETGSAAAKDKFLTISYGDVETQDTGFYGGASLGAMYSFNEKVFINAEYEWTYLSNSYYRDGEVQSAMIGLGFRL